MMPTLTNIVAIRNARHPTMVTNLVTPSLNWCIYCAVLLSRIFPDGRTAVRRWLLSAVAGFVFAVVCAGMAAVRHDEAIPVVYATAGCPADQVVTLDGGAVRCLVRIAR